MLDHVNCLFDPITKIVGEISCDVEQQRVDELARKDQELAAVLAGAKTIEERVQEGLDSHAKRIELLETIVKREIELKRQAQAELDIAQSRIRELEEAQKKMIIKPALLVKRERLAPRQNSKYLNPQKFTFPDLKTPVQDLMKLHVKEIKMRFSQRLYGFGMTLSDGKEFKAGFGTDSFNHTYSLEGKPRLTEIEVYFEDNEEWITQLVFKHEDGSVAKFGTVSSKRMETVVLRETDRLIGVECEEATDRFLMSIAFIVLDGI